MKTPFKTIALAGKYQSEEVAAPLLELASYLERRKVQVLIDQQTAAVVKGAKYPALGLEELGKKADLAIVIGGDGTMLNIARALAPHGVALVGVNQGRLGFLTDISVDNMIATIGAVLDGRFVAEERMLLEGKVHRSGKQVFEALAFNDVVISKGVAGSMLALEARVDGQFIYNQRADGLIVATPTGSTAYALSSGGPILHPSLSVIALVPVSPHTLSNRPIVVSSDCTVEIIVRDNPEPRVHFDSHSRCELRADDRIVVRRYPRPLSLLHPEGHSYYNMLRVKLNWNRE
ncbi:MAG: NAD kinase [Burkholderiales bacterium]